MTDYKEYTRLRDIAQKRIKRMQKSGIKIDVHIPTVKELRSGAVSTTPEQAFSNLSQFVEQGISLSRKRESQRIHYTQEQQAQRKREYQREYRRRKVAKQYERIPNKYQGYLKGLKSLGVDLKPSQLPAFFNYMDYRFAQGNASKKYVFDIFVDDYVALLQKGYKPDQIMNDFQRFEADQIALAGRAENMTGMSVEKAIGLWDKFINQ